MPLLSSRNSPECPHYLYTSGANRESLIPKIKSNKLDVVIVSYDTLRSDFNNVPNDSRNANEGKKAKGKKKKKNTQGNTF